MKRVLTGLSDVVGLTVLLTKRFEKNKKPLTVTIGKPPKTWEQLGYLHSTILPILAEALFDAGEIRNKSEDEAKYILKRMINYGNYYEFNEGVVFDPFSFQKAKIDTLTMAIDRAILECSERGYYVPPPKIRKGK